MSLGCAKPDHVNTLQTPISGLFLTEETSYGIGPVVSDYTRVYAHLQRNGHSRKIEILSGDDVSITGVSWAPHAAIICINEGGFTDTFRNNITLIVGDTEDAEERIHFTLQDNCK